MKMVDLPSNVVFFHNANDYLPSNNFLVGGCPTPLKNMSSSVGMLTFPIYGNIKNVPKYEFVSWDDYSQLNGNIKARFQSTNQI
jgi:hypothetical protein